ncbi:ASCH domain-containing protein [Microbacterium pseudoresistens]|uniref:ASCH domain-containing protein n=1 Tax=Microbacterium pseudoresistens TaxID=640634 RepID=UPI0031B610D7
MPPADAAAVAGFWRDARAAHPELPEAAPEAWAFGATRAHADGLLALVRDGIKTATASSLWDYEATGEALPQAGEYSIILDGAGAPRAVIRTTQVQVVAFDEVSAEHARAEGEDDRSLRSWREIHERYWRAHAESSRGFAPDMPVVCERFELVFQEGSD